MAYQVYVESGPKHRTTMVHVPELLGCVATGGTTGEALEKTPDAIGAFIALLQRHGESITCEDPIEIEVVEHITKGRMLGQGMPYLTLPTDLEPMENDEIERLLDRVGWINNELGNWFAQQSAEAQHAKLPEGRPAIDIGLHVLGAQGSYLASAFGKAPGFGPIRRQVENGNLPIDLGLQQSVELCRRHAENASDEAKTSVRQMNGYVYTLRKALRRMNEHAWEHLAELARRPGGPKL